MNINLSRISLVVCTIIILLSFFLTSLPGGLIPVYGICVILAAIGIFTGTSKNYGVIILILSFLLLGLNIHGAGQPDYRMRSFNTTAHSDLRNAAKAQEAYYVDNQAYADSIEKLVGSTYGLYTSENVTVKVLSASENGYMMEAFHKKGDRKYTIAGPDGEIQVGKYKSKLSAKSYESIFAFGH